MAKSDHPSSGISHGDKLEQRVAEYLAAGEARRLELEQSWLSENPESYAQVARRLDLLGEFGLDSSADSHPRKIGEYSILSRIGWGGMGVVYSAIEPGSGREIALKRIPAERRAIAGAEERFAREIEAVRRLHHPGIVPVLAVDEDGEGPFFTMELVHGPNLGELLRLHAGSNPEQLSAEDLEASVLASVRKPDRTIRQEGAYSGNWTEMALRFVRQVAEALEHAHGRGVVHRDVKPDNILCTLAGRALLVDFGLAHTEEALTLTQSGALVGSLPYMSPEQVSADKDAQGPQSDIYSLGVVLYELLTLREAFPRGNRERLISAVTGGDFVPPRQVRRGLSRRIETVCLTAMAHDPRDRYRTAADMARDLGALLGGRPIEARRPGPWARARSWLIRRPALSTALKAGGLVGVLGAGLLVWREVEARNELELERVRAGAELAAQQKYSDELLEEQRLRSVAVVEAQRLRAEDNFERSEWAAVAAVDVLVALNPALSAARTRSEMLEEACDKLRVSLKDYPDNLAFALQAVGWTQASLGEVLLAESLMGEAIQLYDQAGFDRGSVRARAALGDVLIWREDYDKSELLLQEALRMSGGGLFAAYEKEPGRIHDSLARLDFARGEFDPAEAHVNAALAWFRADPALQAWEDISHEVLAEILLAKGEIEAGEDALRVAEAFWLGPRSADILDGEGELLGFTGQADSLGVLASLRAKISRSRNMPELESRQWRRSIDLLEEAFIDGHPSLDASYAGLAEALWTRGDAESAVWFEKALAGYRQYLAAESPTIQRIEGRTAAGQDD